MMLKATQVGVLSHAFATSSSQASIVVAAQVCSPFNWHDMSWQPMNFPMSQ